MKKFAQHAAMLSLGKESALTFISQLKTGNIKDEVFASQRQRNI